MSEKLFSFLPSSRVFLAALLLVASGFGSLPGQLSRLGNSTLALPASLSPSAGYHFEDAFPGLTFPVPVALKTPPGETNRLFVVSQLGSIYVIPDLAKPTQVEFLNISHLVTAAGENGLLGLAFHPDYAANGYFFVIYTYLADGVYYQRLSRFRVSADDPNRASASSERIFLQSTCLAPNHKGGELNFGADGYLYFSVGDDGDRADGHDRAQRVDQGFFSGIFRIDVDRRPTSLEPNPHPAIVIDQRLGTARFAVPSDNPFVGATSFNGLLVDPAAVRTEFWATGLRNPYRFSFDPPTGELWVGDVGELQVEEINLIQKGGNYGWAYLEGILPGPKANPPPGFQPIPPLYSYPHTNFNSAVIGGFVYRGSKFPELVGRYLFGDFTSNSFWALQRDGETGSVRVDALAQSWGSWVSFGVNPRTGDILGGLGITGRIERLVRAGAPSDLPTTLSATGAFEDLVQLRPSPGVVPYAPNVSFWSDYAVKRRWFSVPSLGDFLTYSPSGNWGFPTGTVWIKHFDLEMIRGVPTSSRRVETRLLVRSTDGIYGLSYAWNEAQTEASLVSELGSSRTFPVTANGQMFTQTWTYPSRSDCLQCHSAVAGYALGFNAPQLNGNFTHGAATQNQLQALSAAGYFSKPINSLQGVARLSPATDTSRSVEWRARSYLSANCSQCHQPGGGAGRSLWDARISTPLAEAGIVNGPVVENLGDPLSRVVSPGDPARSVLYQRLAAAPGTSTHMPPLGSNELDHENLALVRSWIEQIQAPPSRLSNFSARAYVGAGENAGIGGFVVVGPSPKRVLVRALGPSLARFGVSSPLGNPRIQLRSAGGQLLASNADWRDTQESAIEQTGIPPSDDREAAIVQLLQPGAYTTVIEAEDGLAGVALIEVYELNPTDTNILANSSARALVRQGDGVLIAGFVVSGSATKRIVARGLGPSLAAYGIANPLANPDLHLYAADGTLIAANDDWRQSQAVELLNTGLAPSDEREGALLVALPPGAYTVVLSGVNNSVGVGLLEIYGLE